MALDLAKQMMTARLVDSVYTEAMLLADEARGYFDEIGQADRDALEPYQRVAYSCESLKVTTRLMHIIAWLLTRKAIASGEIASDSGGIESRRLGAAVTSDADSLAGLPDRAIEIIAASLDLYDRVARIDQGLVDPEPVSPAHDLLRRIERAL